MSLAARARLLAFVLIVGAVILLAQLLQARGSLAETRAAQDSMDTVLAESIKLRTALFDYALHREARPQAQTEAQFRRLRAEVDARWLATAVSAAANEERHLRTVIRDTIEDSAQLFAQLAAAEAYPEQEERNRRTRDQLLLKSQAMVSAIATLVPMLNEAQAKANRQFEIAAFALGGLLLVMTLLTAFALEAYVLRPLARLRRAADDIAGGNLALRLRSRRRDEIGALSAAFDSMLDNLQRGIQALAESRDRLAEEVAEHALAEVQVRKLTLAVEQSSESIVITDLAGQLEYVNESFVRLTGYSREEALGQNPRMLKSGKTPAATYVALWQALTEGRSWQGEFINRRKNGEEYIARAHISPIRQPDGRISHYISVGEDITEKIQMRDELERYRLHLEGLVVERTMQLTAAKQAAEAANVAKSGFLANMSHELRTPLNAIIGFSEVLKDGLIGQLAPQQQEYMSEIYSAGEHLLSLINDVLDLSKIEAGQMNLELEPVSPAKLLAGSLSMVKEKAMKRHIALTLDTTAAEGELLADNRKLKQIVYNLLANAVKFTADGGEVALTARRATRAEMGAEMDGKPAPGLAMRRLPAPADGDSAEYLAIAVRDNGIGIAAADLDHLFESFVQLDSSLDRKYEGTGLGLALVRRLVVLHGGALDVSSAPGRGSCFQVWLPWRTATAAATTTITATPPPAVIAAPASRLVLVADDDPQAMTVFVRFLEDAGFRTLSAADGEECLRVAKTACPDLICLDLLMPRLDGFETLERLKADPTLANIPVVVMSTMAGLKQGIALGAARVIQKPVRRADLLDALVALGLPGKGHQRRTLLLVDDDPLVHDLITLHLAGSRYRLLHALGGQDGIDQTLKSKPDLVVLDLMMPGVNGFEVVEALRARPETAHVPVLVLTSAQLDRAERERLSGEVRAIMQKSEFSPAALLNEVERALAQGRERL